MSGYGCRLISSHMQSTPVHAENAEQRNWGYGRLTRIRPAAPGLIIAAGRFAASGDTNELKSFLTVWRRFLDLQ